MTARELEKYFLLTVGIILKAVDHTNNSSTRRRRERSPYHNIKVM